jgi:hypothetical protein
VITIDIVIICHVVPDELTVVSDLPRFVSTHKKPIAIESMTVYPAKIYTVLTFVNLTRDS